jgi:anaerobic selenocysteine-containing dehydrogenase
MTDTAAEADIIIPAKNMFEQSDIIGSYWNPYVQLKPKILEPAGEVKPETEIYYLMAQRLRYSKEEISKWLPEPGDENIQAYLKQRMKAFPQLKWEELQEGPVLAPGLEEIAFSNLRFNTPSGKIELKSDVAKELWGVNQLPTYEELIEGEDRHKAEYSIQLLSPNTKNRIHSQFGNLAMIRRLAPYPYLLMNASDAMERGVSDRDMVKVFNARGTMNVTAKLSFSIRKGCASYYNGLWLSEGGTPNLFSKGRETDMGHGAAFHDTLVEIERVK